MRLGRGKITDVIQGTVKNMLALDLKIYAYLTTRTSSVPEADFGSWFTTSHMIVVFMQLSGFFLCQILSKTFSQAGFFPFTTKLVMNFWKSKDCWRLSTSFLSWKYRKQKDRIESESGWINNKIRNFFFRIISIEQLSHSRVITEK